MKKLSLFLATCALGLLANVTTTSAQTPPPVSTNCGTPTQYTKPCWADTGYARGGNYGASCSYNDYLAESQRANSYADYYRAQPYSDENACLTIYWDYYLDGLYTGYSQAHGWF